MNNSWLLVVICCVEIRIFHVDPHKKEMAIIYAKIVIMFFMGLKWDFIDKVFQITLRPYNY